MTSVRVLSEQMLQGNFCHVQGSMFDVSFIKCVLQLVSVLWMSCSGFIFELTALDCKVKGTQPLKTCCRRPVLGLIILGNGNNKNSGTLMPWKYIMYMYRTSILVRIKVCVVLQFSLVQLKFFRKHCHVDTLSHKEGSMLKRKEERGLIELKPKTMTERAGRRRRKSTVIQ